MRTSETHPLMIDALPFGAGILGMTLCPGRKGPSLNGQPWNRDLDTDVGLLRTWGATMVVSLTEAPEMERLGVADLGSAVQAAGIAWLHLPIPDTGTPEPTWPDRWRQASPEIHQELANGGRVVIHCRAGLERTALVVALLQFEHGRDLDTALGIIAEARPGARPLPDQKRWLEIHFANIDPQARADGLDAFLLNHPPIAQHTAVWADGTIRLGITTHLVGEEAPPSAYTTSSRCIVLANDSVLVMRNPDSRHILPGGRLEPGEDSHMAVVREVQEETGLHLTDILPLAIMVFRHQTPRPDGYPYPYPVFTNDIFVSRLSASPPVIADDDYEQGGEFMPISEALALIAPHERELLRAALSLSTT